MGQSCQTHLSREGLVAACVAQLTKEPDFPAISEHVRRVMTAIEDEETSLRTLTGLSVRMPPVIRSALSRWNPSES